METLKIKSELRELIDAYAILGDEKKISEQMMLLTPDVIYKAYIQNFLVADISGRDNLKKEFRGHASEVKIYFTINGQHIVKIDGDTATGVSFSQLKMIREIEGKDILTDYSVKYDDTYVHQNGKWSIKGRTGYFLIVEARPIIR